MQYHADTNHRCNRGWTALHESVSRNDLEVMEILVSGGAKVEAKNAYGITPLFVAAQGGQLEALRFLAKYGELGPPDLAQRMGYIEGGSVKMGGAPPVTPGLNTKVMGKHPISLSSELHALSGFTGIRDPGKKVLGLEQ